MEHIYERDYTKCREEPPQELKRGAAAIIQEMIRMRSFNGGPEIKTCTPKAVIPKDKETFERLTAKFDVLAKRRGGRIKAVVDDQGDHASIEVQLPFWEASYPEEYALLKDVANNTHYFLIQPGKQGGVVLYFVIHYFEIEESPSAISEEEMAQIILDVQNALSFQ